MIAIILIFVLFSSNATFFSSIFGRLGNILRPFITGFLFAYLLNIPIAKLEKRFPRAISIFLVYLVSIGIVVYLVSHLIPILMVNVKEFSQGLPGYIHHTEHPILQSIFSMITPEEVMTYVTAQIAGISSYAIFWTGRAVNLLFAIVISIYTLIYKESILLGIKKIASAPLFERFSGFEGYVDMAHQMFCTFMFCQFVASVVLMGVSTVVLSLLGVGYAHVFGVLLGVGNLVPFFGSLVATVVIVGVVFLTNATVPAVMTTMFLLLLQQVDATIITPKLMGRRMNLNPLLVIFALSVGGAYFGFLGVLFAVPIAATVRMAMDGKTGAVELP